MAGTTGPATPSLGHGRIAGDFKKPVLNAFLESLAVLSMFRPRARRAPYAPPFRPELTADDRAHRKDQDQ